VVTAQLVDPATGTCRIVRQWNSASLPEEIVIAHLDETAIAPAGDWIIPLINTRNEWDVAPSPLSSRARLVYPATPEAVQQ
ncbi:MAG: hypothetical protein JNG89_00550, partial [Planctomycetaceae bacterium]|nr:hypothetical protein [Planctomycetaceae bacterium]